DRSLAGTLRAVRPRPAMTAAPTTTCIATRTAPAATVVAWSSGGTSEATSTARATLVHTVRARAPARSSRASRPQPARAATTPAKATAGAPTTISPSPARAVTSTPRTGTATIQTASPAAAAPATAAPRRARACVGDDELMVPPRFGYPHASAAARRGHRPPGHGRWPLGPVRSTFGGSAVPEGSVRSVDGGRPVHRAPAGVASVRADGRRRHRGDGPAERVDAGRRAQLPGRPCGP